MVSELGIAPVRAVIFDMDGLLLNTEGVYTAVTQQIASRFGKTFDWEVKQNTIGRGARDLAEYVVGALELPMSVEDFLAEREPLLQAGFADSLAKPSVVSLVRQLARRGVPIAVGTSSSRAYVEIKTARHRDWFGLFDVVVTADDQRTYGRPSRRPTFSSSRLGVSGWRRTRRWCLNIRRSALQPFGRSACR